MTSAQALLRLDHEHAELLVLDVAAPAWHLHAHEHDTAQHHSAVRDRHEFFAEVCRAIDAFGEVLLVGSRQATADFERYVGKHHPATSKRIVATQVVDHPTERELVALGRAFFDRRARLGGVFGSR